MNSSKRRERQGAQWPEKSSKRRHHQAVATKRPELSWSIFHSRELDLSYARTVVRQAGRFDVDSLELCGGCHGNLQGLEGGIFYQKYPGAISQSQAKAVRANIRKLRSMARMAHAGGMPLYYWHREVCVPSEILQLEPGLLDDRGEFDLLGKSYQTLLENKLAEFFENVPEVDGIVLTLTEADYSVIHNSRPDIYPAGKVVESLLRIFSEAHRRLGKRFILRSFGSIEQDHRDLFAGVAAARGARFEVETKVTPFDWSPYSPCNPWLRPLKNQRISVEMDAMGEYFGPGVIPSPCPEEMLRYLDYALSQKVDRIALRIDRCDASALGTVQEVNLEAVSRRLRSKNATVGEAWEGWAGSRNIPDIHPLAHLMRRNFEVVKLSRYIKGSMIFHTFPISPSMAYLKLGGIFALFRPGEPLRRQEDMWSIRSKRRAPTEAKLIEEKRRAVVLAGQILSDFRGIEHTLTTVEAGAIREWLENGLAVALLMLEFCGTIQAYFREMTSGRSTDAFLEQASDMIRLCRKHWNPAVAETHAKPMLALIQALKKEFRAERRARQRWKTRRDIADFVICGGLLDEYRLRRVMHGSGSRLMNNRQERAVGSRVFPNGSLEYELRAAPGQARILIEAEKTEARLLVQAGRGVARVVEASRDGKISLPVSIRSRHGRIRIRISRGDASYPWIHAVAIQQDPAV